MAMAVIVVLFGAVAFFVWLGLSTRRAITDQLQTLADSVCPSCGKSFDLEVATAAREGYIASCGEAQRLNPEKRINFARSWEVSCPNCKIGLLFRFESGELEANAA